jgi:hypothetical protein
MLTEIEGTKKEPFERYGLLESMLVVGQTEFPTASLWQD